MGQIFVQPELIVLLSDFGILGGVKGNRPVNQGRKAFQLHFSAANSDVGLDAGNVPEAGAFFDQIGKAALDQHVNGDALVVIVERIVVNPANGNFAEIDQRPAGQRAEIRGVQMNHQLAVVDTVLRLGIEGDKVVLRFAPTRHHADIVTADQRIKAGDARQRGFRRDQPELRVLAQGVFHIALNAGRDLYLTQVLA